jgi:uncharacterized delta-60 repeat protein
MPRRRFDFPPWLPVFLFAFCTRPDALAQTVDAFNPDVRDVVWTTAFQSDGAILIGGTFTNAAGAYRHHFACLAPNGALQTNMNIGVTREVYAIAVQDDGRVLIGGDFLNYRLTNGAVIGSCNYLARFLPDGSPDPAFKGNANSFVTSLIVQRDQKVVVAGMFSTLSGFSTSFGLGRLEPSGQADTNFILNARGHGTVACVAIQPDGRILVGGGFTQLGGRSCTNLGRLNIDGTLDDSFHPGFGGSVKCMAVQPDGKILLNGIPYSSLSGSFLRLNSDGTQDTSFSSQSVRFGPVDPGWLLSIALQADGAVIIGGGFDRIGNYYRTNLSRLRPDGAVDAAWWPRPGNNGTIYSLAQQADGHTVVAGEFYVLAGQSRKFIGRLSNPETAYDELKLSRSSITWSLGGSSPAYCRVAIASSVNGVDWTQLGEASAVSGGWNLSGLSLSPGLVIRARGYAVGGYRNGSSWFVERTVAVPDWPRIVSDDSRFGVSSQQFGFNVAGAAGQQFVIESSGDLTDWTPVATNTLGAEPFYFSQPLLPAPGARFYRLR